MHVKFNKIMKIPEQPTQIQNDTIVINQTTYPVVKLEVVAGKYSDPTKLKFNWTLVEFNQKELLINLEFENIGLVSSQKRDPDLMQMTFYGFYYFSDSSGNFI